MKKYIIISTLLLAHLHVFAVKLSLQEHKQLTGQRAWREPSFDAQANALGWSPTAFKAPAKLQEEVQFWVNIYTKYSTNEGVIHEVDNLARVHRVVRFGDLAESVLSPRMLERLKERRVETAKREIVNELQQRGRRIQVNDLRMQLGQSDQMRKAIFLSGRYLEDFEKIFRAEGLPIELTRLVFVESSFNVLAQSKVGASGLWQIMPTAARPFKIMNSAVDGRNHPLTATRTAAKILKYNYRKLGSWPLAVTGYNHGPSGIQRLVKRYETEDLPTLIRDVRSSRNFGFASRNFYASFLAALEVEKNANKYFPEITWSKKFDVEDLKLPQPVKYADLLRWFEHDEKLLRLVNPHLSFNARKKAHAIPARTVVSVPSTKINTVMLSLGGSRRSIAQSEQEKTEQKSR